MKKLLLVGTLTLGVGACTPDINQDPAPAVAQFDPAASPAVVPSPNDLAINPATGLVNAPIDPNSPAAQQEFTREYLNTLNGFPTSVAATTKIADLNKDTVSPTTVRFIDLLQGQPIATPPVTPTISYNEETDTLSIAPPTTGWPKGGRYAVALIGGENGLKGTNGLPVVGSSVWAFVSNERSLVTCEELSAPNCAVTPEAAALIPSEETDPAERLRDQTASALALEQLRRSYKPLMDVLVTQGVKREDIVLLWTFRIMNRPEATFDPAASIIPFPNDILLKRNPDGTTQLNLPVPPNASPTQQQLFAGLNTLDGFSTTAPIVSENSDARGVIDSDSKLDVTNLDAATLFLNLTPGGAQPKVAKCLNCASSGTTPNTPQQLQFVPQLPLNEKSTYGAVLTTDLKDEKGRFVAPTGAFALVRLKNPLVANGKSQVSGISDENAAALEPLRAGLKPMFDAMEANLKLPRSKIALAWAFTTQSTVSTLQRLHALPAQQYGPAGLPDQPLYLFDVTSNTKLQMTGQGLLTANIGKIFQGSIVLPFALTGQSGTLNPAQPRFDRVPFLLSVPASAAPEAGYPVAIFSHGLRSSRNTAIPIINALAGAGYATVAIDTVFHGDRSSCAEITAASGIGEGANAIDTPDKACAVGTCDTTAGSPTYGRCISTTRNTCNPSPAADVPGDVVCAEANQGRCLPSSATDPTAGVCEGGSFKINPTTKAPIISGWNMLNPANLFATRDNFRQHTIEHAQLERVISGAGINTQLAVKGGGKLNGAQIHYIGQSLGGILGTLYTSASPKVQKAVFNASGGDLTNILLTSPSFKPAADALIATLAAQGINQGTPAFDQFIGLARTILDPADPINYIYAVENGPATPAGRQAFVQYIQNDPVIPNPTTKALIDAVNTREISEEKKVAEYMFTEDVPADRRHFFLVDFQGNPSVTARAQNQAVGFLTTGTVSNP